MTDSSRKIYDESSIETSYSESESIEITAKIKKEGQENHLPSNINPQPPRQNEIYLNRNLASTSLQTEQPLALSEESKFNIKKDSKASHLSSPFNPPFAPPFTSDYPPAPPLFSFKAIHETPNIKSHIPTNIYNLQTNFTSPNPFPMTQSKTHRYQIPSISKDKNIRDDIDSSISSDSDLPDTDRYSNIHSIRNSDFDKVYIPTAQVFTQISNDFENIPPPQIQTHQDNFQSVPNNDKSFLESTESIEDAAHYKVAEEHTNVLIIQDQRVGKTWGKNNEDIINVKISSPAVSTSEIKNIEQDKSISDTKSVDSCDFDLLIHEERVEQNWKQNNEDIENATISSLTISTSEIENISKDEPNYDTKSVDSCDFDSDEATEVDPYSDQPANINPPVNINQPYNINQLQLSMIIPDILENFSWLLNHRQMFLSGSHTKIYTTLRNLVEAAPEPMKSACNAFLLSFNCDRCRTNFYEGVTSCNHKLCKECTIGVLKKSTNSLILLTTYEEEWFRSICPKCKKKLLEEDLKVILADEYEKYDFERNKRQIEQDNKHRKRYRHSSSESYNECVSCKKLLTDGMCFDYDTCKHQCKECLALNIRRGITGCPVCKQVYSRQIVHERDICQGCNMLLYFVGHRLTKVCKGHLMCCSCISECYQERKCKICRIEADDDLFMEFDRILFGKCTGPCKEKKNLDSFILKECCASYVCLECQANNKEACIKCNKPLGEWAKKQIGWIPSAQRI